MFETTKFGKPFIPNSDIKFNISHSNDTALIAIGRDQEIGIDLEFHSERELAGIAQKMFSQKEINRLQQINIENSSYKKIFYEIWSGKEAFIKAIGMGLKYPTQTITIPKLTFKPQLLVSNFENRYQEWYIQKLDLGPNLSKKYSSALCVANEPRSISFKPKNQPTEMAN